MSQYFAVRVFPSFFGIFCGVAVFRTPLRPPPFFILHHSVTTVKQDYFSTNSLPKKSLVTCNWNHLDKLIRIKMPHATLKIKVYRRCNFGGHYLFKTVSNILTVRYSKYKKTLQSNEEHHYSMGNATTKPLL